jgi:hypothetical protein
MRVQGEAEPPDQGKVDLSELIKIVEITVENDSDTRCW